MARTIRFHLDECCDPAVAIGLRRRDIDVTTSQEAGLLKAADARQAAYGIGEILRRLVLLWEIKVRDALAGLASARFRAGKDEDRDTAQRALRAEDPRVVLHLEQPPKPSKLFPRAIDPANVLADLKRKVKGVDPHPLVVEIATADRVPWGVESVGRT